MCFKIKNYKMNIVSGPHYYNQIKFKDKFIHNFGERHTIITCDDNKSLIYIKYK